MSGPINQELPEGWSCALLKEVAARRLGKMLDARKQVNGTPLPYLRNINVRWAHGNKTQRNSSKAALQEARAEK
jgi:hypothetical protein